MSFIKRQDLCLIKYYKVNYNYPYGDGEGSVGPTNTHYSSQKYIFGIERRSWGFQTSHHERTASPVGLLRIEDYPVGASEVSSFGFSAGYGNCGVGRSTTHLTYHKFYYWVDGGNIFLSRNRYYSYTSH